MYKIRAGIRANFQNARFCVVIIYYAEIGNFQKRTTCALKSFVKRNLRFINGENKIIIPEARIWYMIWSSEVRAGSRKNIYTPAGRIGVTSETRNQQTFRLSALVCTTSAICSPAVDRHRINRGIDGSRPPRRRVSTVARFLRARRERTGGSMRFHRPV